MAGVILLETAVPFDAAEWILFTQALMSEFVYLLTGVGARALAVIQVNFLDQTNHGVAHRQVLVAEFPIAVSTADNGTKKYTTLLSDLLPAVIQNDSPIKKQGGRLYRSNIRDEPTAPHHLGKINTLLAKSSNALLTRQMNEYNLVPLSDGSFVCDVFWEQPSITRAAGSTGDTSRRGTGCGYTITGPLQFTGTGSDVPLHIANSRAQFSPLHEHALPGLRAEFVDFLHAKVKAEVPNMPDQGYDWGRCKYVGESLDRYLLQQAAFDFFAGWGRTAGGFAVPRGHDKISGVSFKKELIFEVLNIKSSSTSDINKLFAPERLEKAPKAKAWVNSKGETNDDSFRKMTTIGFKKYLQEDHRKVRKLGRGNLDIAAPGLAALVARVFFPDDLSLHKALYLFGVIISLYPLLRLHLNQRHQPRQPAQTAWMKAFRDLLIAAFRPEDEHSSIWAAGLDQSREYADYICEDLASLYMMLGLNPYDLVAPSPPPLSSDPRTVEADLTITHCASCQADYHPDCITYRDNDNHRLQRLETTAQLQTKNDVRQSQRLFIEHFSRRLLLFLNKHANFTCEGQPSTRSLTEAVRATIGENGGVLATAMTHGCVDCTHIKRYCSDLVNEGILLGTDLEDVAGMAASATDDNAPELAADDVVDQLGLPQQQAAPQAGTPRRYIRLAVMDGKTIQHRKCALHLCEGPLVNYKNGRFCQVHLDLADLCTLRDSSSTITDSHAYPPPAYNELSAANKWLQTTAESFPPFALNLARLETPREIRRYSEHVASPSDGVNVTGQRARFKFSPFLIEFGWTTPSRNPVSLRTMTLVAFFDTSSRKIPTVRGFAQLNLWWMPGIISGTARHIFCVAYGPFLFPPCNPAPTNGSQPDLILVEEDANGTKHQTRAFNTETAEQLNSWLNGFESQLRQMSDVNYDFFIHVLRASEA
ncbi:hypothetical protein B0H14DRAFT_3131234 [Mycena olivaceomarginata]|nr:hypothetical protein B0H14DRAFT_3131234 [Mycena olivaceomarginata]